MIFRKSFEQVLAGDKTQTRRPKKPGDEWRLEEGKLPYVYNNESKRVKYMTGRDYAIQSGQGQPGLGKLRILDIRVEEVQDISPTDALAEGLVKKRDEGSMGDMFDHMAGFIEAWDSLYKGGLYDWRNNPTVYVIEFEVVENYR